MGGVKIAEFNHELWGFVAVVIGLGAVMACPWFSAQVVGLAACLLLFSIGLFVGRQSR